MVGPPGPAALREDDNMEGLKGLTLLLLVSLGVLLAIAVAAGEGEGATITVPDDYPTIDSAVENATDYDTIFIKDGVYNEMVVVWRPLTIMGESQDGTVLEYDTDFSLLVIAPKCSLSNFTVRGPSVAVGFILQTSNCIVEDVTIQDSLWGLWVNRGTHNTIRNVRCIDNAWQGVLVEEADHTLLQGVTCSGNNEGITVRAAVGTVIKGCTCRDNRFHGLLLQRLEGIYETEDVVVQDCDLSHNGANGLWVSETDHVVVQGCEASNNYANGMEFSDSDHVTVEGCTVEDSNWTAIRADRCNDVTIMECWVSNYTRIGIGVQGEARDCLIENNQVRDEERSWSDVVVHGMQNNVIRGNYVRCASSAISVLWANNTIVSDNVVESNGYNETAQSVGMIVGRHRSGVNMPPTNVTLLRNVVRDFSEGIRVRGGWDVDILECTITGAQLGIYFHVFDYGDDPIVGGSVMGCTLEGCGMVIEGMIDVTVEGNTISGVEVGILFNATTHAIKDNVFIENVIEDCSEYGLYFNGTNGTNRFHKNAFINNGAHSSVPFDDDLFDDGMMYGNYWDDFEEMYPDAEVSGRVWDTPYAVGGGTVMDRYPLAYAYDTTSPVADAGQPTDWEAGDMATLDGAGSSDDGVIVVWTWSFAYADTPVELHGEEAHFPFILVGTYEVTLEVEDAWGNTDSATTTVSVHDTTDPVADGGPDIEVPMGEGFTLTGSASTDNGFIASYEWLVDPEGLDRVLEGESATFTIAVAGDYPVVLRVTDEAGNIDIDEVVVTVLDTEPPVADAGPDRTVDQGDSVTLIGRWCRDNVGLASWTWTFHEGDEVVIEVGPIVERAFPFAGTYQVFLNVTDAAGNWAVDDFELTVVDIETPMADAGENVHVDQGTLVTLDGTGSTDNVGVVAFFWRFAEDSVLKELVGAGPTYRFDVPGEFELELQAWDAAGNVGFDWVIVRVDANITSKQWMLGPFKDDDGPLGGVRVEATLGGNPYVAYTDDLGNAQFTVQVDHLVSPASVKAEKQGWKTLNFDMEMDTGGDPTGTVPVMERTAGDGGNEVGEETDWLAWGLVIVLIIAFAGTLLYLSAAAKRAGD